MGAPKHLAPKFFIVFLLLFLVASSRPASQTPTPESGLPRTCAALWIASLPPRCASI